MMQQQPYDPWDHVADLNDGRQDRTAEGNLVRIATNFLFWIADLKQITLDIRRDRW